MLDRRTFLGALAGGLVAAPLAAELQPVAKVYRIGSVNSVMPTTPQGQGPFYDRMRELGWVHGQNFVVERRAYGDQIERIPDLAAELMRSGVDIFIVSGSTVSRRLQQVTRTSRSSRLTREISYREDSRPASPDLAATSPESRP